MKLTIFSDGGARGNPGPAGIGFVISSGEQILKQHGEHIGETTNNQAEYQALIKGLSAAKDMGGTEIQCYLDSELVFRQLQGKYKVREEGLKSLIGEVLKLTRAFAKIEFTHVPREKNKLADELVNKALDDAGF